jgi:hypothetical protein
MPTADAASDAASQEAAAAYDRAAVKRKGDDATLNFETLEIAEAAVKAAKEAWVPEVDSPKAFQPVGKSGYLGVREARQAQASGGLLRWESIIHYNAKGHSLGTFATKEEAAAAYDAAVRRHKPAGAPTNFSNAEVEAEAVEEAVLEHERAKKQAALAAANTAQRQAAHLAAHGAKSGARPPKKRRKTDCGDSDRPHSGMGSAAGGESTSGEKVPRSGMSGYLGVKPSRQRWVSTIYYGAGQKKGLGTFDTKEVSGG